MVGLAHRSAAISLLASAHMDDAAALLICSQMAHLFLPKMSGIGGQIQQRQALQEASLH
jgi:hypothetical protein